MVLPLAGIIDTLHGVGKPFLVYHREGSHEQAREVKMASLSSKNNFEFKFIAELDDDLKVHESECEHTVIACKYESIGKLWCEECLRREYGADKPCPNCRTTTVSPPLCRQMDATLQLTKRC